MERRIPRCMSTQHPDNVSPPPFTTRNVLQGEDEIQEAFHVFSYLGADEQMWDYEGKEVDHFVVRKLLANYQDFFQENLLGKDFFITYRVPNPRVEKDEGKWLLETLRSIPRSYDMALEFYGDRAIPPILEVIFPMTTSSLELERVYKYYTELVAGEEGTRLINGDITIGEWVGRYKPQRIGVIPLFEDIPNIVNCDRIVEEFLNRNPEISYQRVFLARSDPALNYGYTSAFLALEVALSRLDRLEKKLGKPLYPILGVGSSPFRGNFKPTNVDNCLASYPSVQTFTIQSSFKYDYPQENVKEAVLKIKAHTRAAAREVDEERSEHLIARLSANYQRQVKQGLAKLANNLSKYIPPRRKRKLHIGLYGYSRGADGIFLPRAITYCAALYSVGVPPEIVDLAQLGQEDWEYLLKDKSFYSDLQDAMAFVNEDILLSLVPEARTVLDHVDYQKNLQHEKLGRMIYQAAKDEISPRIITDMVTEAASLRGFLG